MEDESARVDQGNELSYSTYSFASSESEDQFFSMLFGPRPELDVE